MDERYTNAKPWPEVGVVLNARLKQLAAVRAFCIAEEVAAMSDDHFAVYLAAKTEEYDRYILANRAAELVEALRELHNFAVVDSHDWYVDRSRAAFIRAAELLKHVEVN